MAYLTPNKQTASPGAAIWQQILTTVSGGFALDTTGLTVGQVLKAGSAVAYDEATRKAKKAAADGSDAKIGLTKEDIIIDADVPVTVVIAGVVLERRLTVIPAPVKAKMPLITFSQSF